jgi:hypothetical protein
LIFSTSVAVTALCGMICTSSLTLTWQTDYRVASEMAAKSHKPLAVFITNSTDAVTRDLSSDARRILNTNYVSVIVDSKDATGKLLSERFEMSVGVVISDRTGGKQAMRIEGTTNPANLADILGRLSQSEHVTMRTEVQAPVSEVPLVTPVPLVVSAPLASPVTVSSAPMSYPSVAPVTFAPVATSFAPTITPAVYSPPVTRVVPTFTPVTATVCRT